MSGAAQVLEASYEFPFLAHAPRLVARVGLVLAQGAGVDTGPIEAAKAALEDALLERGIGRDGERKDTYQPGVDLLARQTPQKIGRTAEDGDEHTTTYDQREQGERQPSLAAKGIAYGEKGWA